MSRALLPLVSSLLLSACASQEMSASDYWDTAASDAAWGGDVDESAAPARLRVDILPSGDSAYLPQSVVFDLSEVDPVTLLENLALDLAPTRRLEGQVTAFDAAPYSDVTVPGSTSVPLVGRVGLSAPAGQARKTVDVENGLFAIELPAASDYRLVVQPADSERQPFTIIEPFDLTNDDTDFTLDLGFGSPVHGRVVQSDGTVAPGVTEVWLEDLDTGLAGPRVPTDSSGNFMLRAFEGEYRLVAEGSERSTIPRVATDIIVVGGEATRVDLDLGFVAPVEASGRVLDSDGSGLYQASIRFTALDLDDAEGSMVVEDDADSDGDFELDVLPGLWRVEVIPPFDSNGALAPVRLDDVVVGAEGVDLGALSLPERVSVTGVVEDAGGGKVGAVTVVARELGFDNYVYTAVADAEGRFDIAVPDVPLEVAYLPAQPRHTVTWVEYPDGMPGLENIVLSAGINVRGVVNSPAGPSSATLVDIVDADTGRSYGTALTNEDGEFSLRVALDGGGGWLEPGAGDTGW